MNTFFITVIQQASGNWIQISHIVIYKALCFDVAQGQNEWGA